MLNETDEETKEIETNLSSIQKEIEQLDNISIFDIRKYGRASIIFARMTN